MTSPLARAGPAAMTVLLTVILSASCAGGSSTQLGRPAAVTAASGPAPSVRNVTSNAASYPGGQVPRYQRLELTFQVDTQAQNPQLPYDAAPPPGVQPGLGVTVDALFTPDNWQTIYPQPAFLYQEFDLQSKGARDWIYPTGASMWKVRFAPTQVGAWQFKLRAQDAGGVTETAPQAFSVAPSAKPGFLRVSPTDARYFEFQDGTYFPALGYNLNFNQVTWDDPLAGNTANFQQMSRNGIQLARIWLSQWGIFTSGWNPWNSVDPSQHAQYIPWAGMSFAESVPGSEVSMKIDAQDNPCMFLGFMKASPAVKRNTEYRVRIRYKATNMTGPRVAGQPYGFVAKTGGWLWGNGTNCYDAGVGQTVTPRQSSNTADWQILEGALNSGDQDFLPMFYLAAENLTRSQIYIDYVWIEENRGGGQYGPNIVSKPWMAQHLYFDQRASFAFDKVVELAEQYGVYLRPVVLEKNEWLLNHFDYNGAPTAEICPPIPLPGVVCPDNKWFYGNWRQMTKTRWLQQAWWRYLQARWGYSPTIHSWELLNEGDPYSGLHYTLADEFGKYMRQFTANRHMVSTSTWHSFPTSPFWSNPDFPNLDFADVHQYIQEGQAVTLRVDTQYDGQGVALYGPADFYDTAASTQKLSQLIGATRPYGTRKPVIRGETGLIDANWSPIPALDNDHDGVWLHNYLWGGLNSGGLIESYWFVTQHIYRNCQPSGAGGVTCDVDHRPQFAPYFNFIRSIPLNNGHYQDADARWANPNLRAWGQKDLANGTAHLWLANAAHTWKNVIDGVAAPPVTDVVQIPGFTPGRTYTVDWWDTYQADPLRQVLRSETLVARADGTLPVSVINLTTDTAVKIHPTTCASTLTGDVNCDCVVDANDVQLVASHWGARRGTANYDARYDLDGNGSIDIVDIMLVSRQWGQRC